MNTLITICARAGSKGLPNKATAPFNGKPLIQWTIEQAKAWGKGDIALSSDYPKCLVLASDFGIQGLNRSRDLAQDDTPKIPVIRNALEWIEKLYSRSYDVVVDLDICNPLRRTRDIEACYQKFLKDQPDVLYSVTPARRNPYFNLVQIAEREDRPYCPCVIGGEQHTRRQDAPQCYDINCCIYVYSRDWLLNDNNKSVHHGKVTAYIMEDWQFCDIDNAVDLGICEYLHGKYILNGQETL